MGALNSCTMIVGAPKHFNAHIFSTPAYQMDANGGEADALPTRAISRVLTIFFLAAIALCLLPAQVTADERPKELIQLRRRSGNPEKEERSTGVLPSVSRACLPSCSRITRTM